MQVDGHLLHRAHGGLFHRRGVGAEEKDVIRFQAEIVEHPHDHGGLGGIEDPAEQLLAGVDQFPRAVGLFHRVSKLLRGIMRESGSGEYALFFAFIRRAVEGELFGRGGFRGFGFPGLCGLRILFFQHARRGPGVDRAEHGLFGQIEFSGP